MSLFQSKYYTPILDGLRRIFGTPEATEAELDQTLTQVQSLDELRAAAETAAREDVAGDVQALTARVTAAEGKVTKLTGDANQAAATIAERDNTIATLTAQIATLTTERDTLAGEVATLKSTKPVDQTPPDQSRQTPAQGVTALGGTIIKTPGLADEVIGKKPKPAV